MISHLNQAKNLCAKCQTIFTPISVGDYAPDCHKLIPYSQVTLKSTPTLYLAANVLYVSACMLRFKIRISLYYQNTSNRQVKSIIGNKGLLHYYTYSTDFFTPIFNIKPPKMRH